MKLPEQTNYQIGKYGQFYLDYIKNHRRGRYTTLLTEGKLNARLHEIDLEANELLETIILRLAAERDIDENLKARDMLRWVAEMNNIKAIRKRSSCGRWCWYEVDHQRTLARKHHPARG